MTSSDNEVYRYTIPLETVDGVEQPAHNINTNGTVLLSRLGATTYTLVQTEATPHYHKDSVNVTVEKVDGAEYGYEPEEDTDDEG